MVTPTHRAGSNTRAAGTFARILAATRDLLADDPGALSMRAVAARAGVSHAAIYKHVPSKNELVDLVCRQALTAFDERLVRSVSRHPPGSFERVIAQGVEYIRFALESPEQFRILLTPMRARPRRLRELPGEVGFDLLRSSITEAMQAGNIRTGDPSLAAFFLWSRVHGIVTLLMACDFHGSLPLADAEIHPERLFELSREFLWEGFKPATSADATGEGR